MAGSHSQDRDSDDNMNLRSIGMDLDAKISKTDDIVNHLIMLTKSLRCVMSIKGKFEATRYHNGAGAPFIFNSITIRIH